MDEKYLLVAILFAGFASYIAVCFNKGSERRPQTEPTTNSDVNAMSEGRCPDCGASELLAGPSGGMSQNIGCNNCLMEFNVHHGIGTGVFRVDRTGKMDMTRASVFGISPEEYAANPNSGWEKFHG